MNREPFLNRPHDWTRAPRTASRHELGWRDIHASQDQLDAGSDILKVLAGCLVLWALLALAIVGAVHLLDRI